MKRFGLSLATLAIAGGLLAPPAAAQGEIRIIRDQFGVPHVFAGNEADASYGVGYALAQDRLWQMHVFRHIGKGRLSEIVGPDGVEIDRAVRFYTYTEEERAARFATYPADIQENLQAFADGISAWIDEVKTDPTKMPIEFVELGEVANLDPWTVDDSLSLQDVLILSFGSGGGDELRYAQLLADLTGKFGPKKGRVVFNDLVTTVDPDSPTSIPRGYDFKKVSTRARPAPVKARRALEDDARLLGATGPVPAPDPLPARPAVGTLDQLSLIPSFEEPIAALDGLERGLEQLQYIFTFGSNAQIAGSRVAESRNAIQTGGPQVGYLLPQWLADFGIHGGDFNATGMTFAGAGPAVLIGRGSGYAWTTTTGSSDLSDTYVEHLVGDDPHTYLYKGKTYEMSCRTETYTLRGVVELESEELCRTHHGPVLSIDAANGVAYSVRNAWFNREGQTIEGFFRYQATENIGDFATYANYLSSNHNMFYTDDTGNFGYWHAGNHVIRKPGIDIRLPQDGRGGSEWRGLLPIQQVPHAVNMKRGWLANWNNQPSPGWRRERGHPALDNVLDLQSALDPSGPTLTDPNGGPINRDGKLGFEDMNANLRYAAMSHHPQTYFGRFLPNPILLNSDISKAALRVVKSWDGFNTDRDGDEMYDSAGRTILDRWIAVMRQATFADDLGDLAGNADSSLLWHVIAPNDRLRLRYDWLGKATPKVMASTAFDEAVFQLSIEFDSEVPADWKQPIEKEHYQRLNADLIPDVAQSAAGQPNDSDSGFPGDVEDQISMDRGTYNHIVAYISPARRGRIGRSGVEAGSVIPPGQNGFINLAGQESAHFEDQAPLYLEWRYKPMPMTLDEVLSLMESEQTITRS